MGVLETLNELHDQDADYAEAKKYRDQIMSLVDRMRPAGGNEQIEMLCSFQNEYGASSNLFAIVASRLGKDITLELFEYVVESYGRNPCPAIECSLVRIGVTLASKGEKEWESVRRFAASSLCSAELRQLDNDEGRYGLNSDENLVISLALNDYGKRNLLDSDAKRYLFAFLLNHDLSYLWELSQWEAAVLLSTAASDRELIDLLIMVKEQHDYSTTKDVSQYYAWTADNSMLSVFSTALNVPTCKIFLGEPRDDEKLFVAHLVKYWDGLDNDTRLRIIQAYGGANTSFNLSKVIEFWNGKLSYRLDAYYKARLSILKLLESRELSGLETEKVFTQYMNVFCDVYRALRKAELEPVCQAIEAGVPAEDLAAFAA